MEGFLYGGDQLWPSLFSSLIPFTNDENQYDLVIKNYFHQEELKFIAQHTHDILIKNDDCWRYDLNTIYKDYIKLNYSFQQEIDDFCNNNFKGYHIISVHIRSGAHACEQHNKIMPSRQNYINRINNYISTLTEPYKIFLATDIKEGLNDFINEYKDKLVYLKQDLYYDGQQQYDIQSKLGLLKGKNIMMDAILLSRGDILFHCISNVTFAALYMNPKMKNVYLYT